MNPEKEQLTWSEASLQLSTIAQGIKQLLQDRYLPAVAVLSTAWTGESGELLQQICQQVGERLIAVAEQLFAQASAMEEREEEQGKP